MTQTNIIPLVAPPPPTTPPTAYVVHHTTQVCACCGSSHHHSAVYAETTLRGHWGSRVLNLHRVPWPCPLLNLPIRIIHLKPTTLPFCHSCHEPSLAAWPDPPRPASLGAALGIPSTPRPANPSLDDMLDI